jgi:hypothetical protein
MNRFKNLELVHFPEVDEVDNALIVKNFETFFDKVAVEGENYLKISAKEYSKGGLRKQHELKGQLFLDGEMFFASDTGWKLIETTQNVLKKLQKEVKNKH